jgi:hypothetical protein
MAGFIVSWFFAVTFAVIFQCTPVNFIWNKALASGHCINFEKFIFSTALINIITDFTLVAMPVPILWKLQMPTAKKIGTCGIFLLPGIVIISSVLRLTTLHTVDTYDFACKFYFKRHYLWHKLIDLTDETVDPGVWSTIEPLVGIVGACLPLMTPIFRRVRDRVLISKGSGVTSDEGGRNWQVGLEKGQREASYHQQHGFTDDLPLTVSHKEFAHDGGSYRPESPIQACL